MCVWAEYDVYILQHGVCLVNGGWAGRMTWEMGKDILTMCVIGKNRCEDNNVPGWRSFIGCERNCSQIGWKRETFGYIGAGKFCCRK